MSTLMVQFEALLFKILGFFCLSTLLNHLLNTVLYSLIIFKQNASKHQKLFRMHMAFEKPNSLAATRGPKISKFLIQKLLLSNKRISYISV